ncbi:MAG: hypothetical protein K8S20_15675 [Chloroflexi bacterium]|nr:hypothetical protein [Chloroflexota bacterium]
MKLLKRFSLFEIALISAILGIHLYAAFSDAHNFPNSWFSRDDAYYYFKVAQNITQGMGSTFDGINATNGYHPLWMIVCIPVFFLARFDLILPLRIMLMVMAGLNAATAIIIYRLIKNNLSKEVAILAAAYWAFNLYIHSVVYEFGLETPLAGFTIMLAIWKLSQFEKEWRKTTVSNRQIAALALMGVLVMFSRLDLVFLVVMIGLWLVFRRSSIRFLLPLDIIVIFASMTSAVVLRSGIEAYNSYYSGPAVGAAIISLVIKITCLYFFGGFQNPGNRPFWKTVRSAVLGLSTGTVILTVIYLVLERAGLGKSFPRSSFLTDWIICLVFLLALRTAAFWFARGRAGIPDTPLEELKINWKKWLNDGLVYFGIVGGALLLYMAFNRIAFGTAMPVSGQIKRWWGSIISTAYERPAGDWYSFFGIASQGPFNAWKPASETLFHFSKRLQPYFPGADYVDERYYIALAMVAFLATIILAVNSRRAMHKASNLILIPLASGCALQILSYTNTSYGGAKEWYWISEMILVVLTGSLLIHLAIRPILKFKYFRPLLEFTALTLAVLSARSFAHDIRVTMPYNAYPKDQPYMEVLPFLESNTPPGSVIGMTGGGNVGYFIKDRTIVNMDGLINSYEYFKALQNREAPAYLRGHGLEIIFANSQLLLTPPYYGQFEAYLSNFGSYGGKGLYYLLDVPKY